MFFKEIIIFFLFFIFFFFIYYYFIFEKKKNLRTFSRDNTGKIIYLYIEITEMKSCASFFMHKLYFCYNCFLETSVVKKLYYE
jgi:hypothetical protein